jgi:hypothetical protein
MIHPTPGAWYAAGWDDPEGTPLRILTTSQPANLPYDQRSCWD